MGRTSSAYFSLKRKARIEWIMAYEEYLNSALGRMHDQEELPRADLDAMQHISRLIRREMKMAASKPGRALAADHDTEGHIAVTGEHNHLHHGHSHRHYHEADASHNNETHHGHEHPEEDFGDIEVEQSAMTGHGISGRAGKPGSWGPRATRARQDAIRNVADRAQGMPG